jgi:hypothetical protein
MQRGGLTAGFLLLLLGAIGCGDTPRIIMRDVLTTLNELGDDLIEVDDEGTAKFVMKEKIEPLKKKWDTITKRIEPFSKFDKEQKDEVIAALEALTPESKATGKRVMAQMARITKIRDQLYQRELARQKADGAAAAINPEERWPNLTAAGTAMKLFTVPLGGGMVLKDPEDRFRHPIEVLRPKTKKRPG